MRFDAPEFEARLEQDRVDLVGSGFQPTRHGFLVKLVRRLLWPFLRPFFLHLAHDLTVEKARLELSEERSRTLEGRVHRFYDELAKVVQDHVLVRNDVAALTNRFALLDAGLDELGTATRAQLEGLAAATTALGDDVGDVRSTLGDHVKTVQDGVHELNLRADTISEHLNRLTASSDAGHHLLEAVSVQVAAVRALHSRTLALTSARAGLMLVKPGELISDELLRSGEWDPHILTLAAEVAGSRRGTAVDVGAHIGALTLPLAQLFTRVCSFEPNDFNFRVLRTNVQLNGLGNVFLYNHGLFSHTTELSLASAEHQEVVLSLDDRGEFDGHGADNLGALVFSEGETDVFVHEARTLDSFELQDLVFVKVDVQGADGEVLMGALGTIERCRPVIVFEWEEHLSANFSVDLDTVRRELGQRGYSVEVLKVHNDKQVDYVARPVADTDESLA